MAKLKSEVVFAPAGSGKTERLSRRYIELLEAGVAPERILTLTFTEKAATEMKERIFQRLSEQHPEIFQELRRNTQRLRVSTIHAFCLTLLRRFAPAVGLDPRVDVLTDAEELWNTGKYDTLMAIAEQKDDRADMELLLELVTNDMTIGWDKLSRLFDDFFAQRVSIARGRVRLADRDELRSLQEQLRASPLTGRLAELDLIMPAEFNPATVKAAVAALEANRKLFLTQGNTPRRPRGRDHEPEREWNALCANYYYLLYQDAFAARFARSFDLFRRRFLASYNRRKQATGQVDYDDMEYLALQLIKHDPDWQNVLHAFDEHTDHLLVDEFQDTSYLQWGIIDKLTEEWRSGEGAKAERGIEPTIFIVGDDKQSIYMFRDAKVEVFRNTARRLGEWLGPDRLKELTLKENYRSLDAIIGFNNLFFSKLMACEPDAPAWRTRYESFIRARNNDTPGRVEIILTPSGDTAEDHREADAQSVARRIRALTDPADPFIIHDRNPDYTETPRACRYQDIGILVRTHRSIPFIEQALREHGLPFIISGGTGFYEEPEVRYAIALLTTLVDPADDLALYVTLRGPVFSIPDAAIFLGRSDNAPSLLENLSTGAPPGSKLHQALADLDRWRNRVACESLALILEEALTERQAWRTFWEPQRLANLRRLLGKIEQAVVNGEAPLRILSSLQEPHDEAKAEVHTEDLDAIRIMTVHSAKGLQFPVAFFPALDERVRPMYFANGTELVIEETSPDEVLISWLPMAELRAGDEFHMTYRDKEIEEEKRVFYVACTRARDALFLTGTIHKNACRNTRLGWLVEHLGLDPEDLSLREENSIPGFSVVSSDDIAVPAQPAQSGPKDSASTPPVRRVVSTPVPASDPKIQPITRNLPGELSRHTDDTISTGEIVHRFLELISRGMIDYDDLLGSAITPGPASPDRKLLAGITVERRQHVLAQLATLRNHEPAWSVIAPQENSETELPVAFTENDTVHTGRIDRVIYTPEEIRIYDYKTFPVRKKDLAKLAGQYHQAQLRHYATALGNIHPGRRIRTFIIFTALPEIIETDS